MCGTRTVVAGGFAGLLLAALYVPLPLAAQPVVERILSDVTAVEQDRCALITVQFNLPVRYLSHFPYNSGRDLCIRIRPLAIGANEKAFRFSREALRPPASTIADIASIEYQGDAVGGMCLNVFFRHPVHYYVAQGADYRSIDIVVAGSQPNPACKGLLSEAPADPPGDDAAQLSTGAR